MSKVPWPNLRSLFQENSGHPQLLPVPPPYVTIPPGPPPPFEVPNTTTNSRTTPETLSRTTALKFKPMRPLRRLPPPLSPEVIGTDSPQVSEDSHDSDNSAIGAPLISQDEDEDEVQEIPMSPASSESSSTTSEVPQKIQWTPLRLGQFLLEEPNEDVRIEATETLSIPWNKRKLECLHEDCGKIYSGGRENFKRHILQNHGGILPIQCPLCTTFSSLTVPEMYNHFYDPHKLSMFICPFCDLHMTTTFKVLTHFRKVHGIWARQNLEDAKNDKKRVVEDSKKLKDDQKRMLEASEELPKVQNVQKMIKLVENKSKSHPEDDGEVEVVEEEVPEVQIIKVVPPPSGVKVQDEPNDLENIKDDQKRGLEDSEELSNVQKRLKLVENESKYHPGVEGEDEEESEDQNIKVVFPPIGDQVQGEPNDLDDLELEPSMIQDLMEWLDVEMKDGKNPLWI